MWSQPVKSWCPSSKAFEASRFYKNFLSWCWTLWNWCGSTTRNVAQMFVSHFFNSSWNDGRNLATRTRARYAIFEQFGLSVRPQPPWDPRECGLEDTDSGQKWSKMIRYAVVYIGAPAISCTVWSLSNTKVGFNDHFRVGVSVELHVPRYELYIMHATYHQVPTSILVRFTKYPRWVWWSAKL